MANEAPSRLFAVGDESLSEPPYPDDLRAVGWRFEIDTTRLKQSETWQTASADLRPWLLMVWMTAWEQCPVASLPNDDALIALMIGMPPNAFSLLRNTLLRGFSLHRNGRLYHPVLVENALKMASHRRSTAVRVREYRERMKRVSNALVTPLVQELVQEQVTPLAPKAPAVALGARGWEGIPEETLRLWSQAYPAVSLTDELLRAHAWATANPANRKRSWLRFLTNWLARAQDRAPGRGGGPQPRRGVVA